MRTRAVVAGLMVATIVLARTATPRMQDGPARPKLAVLLVVDQMRADYVDRFKADWTGGLKRLVREGAWFTNAAFPYLTTDTCAGHATISTGAFPPIHGVFRNSWWDRSAERSMTCTADPRARAIGYGGPPKPGDSAFRLQVPTFTDVMRTERGARVAALSLKDRSAIMLAGQGAAAATWLSNTFDGWMTSSAYAAERVPAVQRFVEANPILEDYGKTWNRLLPAARYQGNDEGLAEAPPKGWHGTFPHVLNGVGGTRDENFYVQWAQSPYADAYLGRFAAALAESLHLGKRDGTDVLTVSFATPDLVGHSFGPRSQEVQDIYAHLDRTLGALFARLDAWVGRGQWTVALTSDHGVTPIPEQLAAEGKDAGRLSFAAITDAIERRLRPALGEGNHVALENGNDVYFDPATLTKLQASPSLFESVVSAIAAVPGVQKVFRAEQVSGGEKSDDPLLRAAALSYFPGRSGDVIIAPKPGWMFRATGTTHATANIDDQRVPILFFGRGVKPGRYVEAVTPADVAPTLAALCGVRMPTAEGRVLLK